MLHSQTPFCNEMISKIGLGTAQFGMDYGYTKAKSQNEVDVILDTCVEHGINFLDTARGYGDSEEKIGHYLKRHPKAHFFIATKMSEVPLNIASNFPRLWNHVLSSVETSLRALGINQLQVLQLHQPSDIVIDNDFFWRAIAQLKQRGLIRFFGISVYEIEEAQILIHRYGKSIDFIQVPYSVFDQRFERLFSWFDEHEIGVISRSAFLKGIIPAANEEIPDELTEIKRFKQLLSDLASLFELSVHELALLFAVSSELIQTTLIGVDSSEQLLRNVEALSKLKLICDVKSEMKQLEIADAFLIDPRRWTRF